MKERVQLRRWMVLSAFLYLSGGVVFLFWPRQLMHAIDLVAVQLRLATVHAAIGPAERFWNLLAFAMAMTITTASVMVVADDQQRLLHPCHLLQAGVLVLGACVLCLRQPSIRTFADISCRFSAVRINDCIEGFDDRLGIRLIRS
jgi:hypothetical protein